MEGTKFIIPDNADLHSINLGVSLNGNDAIIRPIIYTDESGSENIIIEGIEVDANGGGQVIPGTGDHLGGICLYESRNSTVRNCHVYDVGGTDSSGQPDGLGISVLRSTDCRIYGNLIERSGYENIAIRINSHRIIISNNHLLDGGRCNLQASAWAGVFGATNVIISNNTFHNGGIIIHGHELTEGDGNIVSHVQISSNTFSEDNPGTAIFLQDGSSHISICDNIINTHHGFSIKQADRYLRHILISGNSIRCSGIAMELWTPVGGGLLEHLTVAGNNIHYIPGTGATIQNCIVFKMSNGYSAKNINISQNSITAIDGGNVTCLVCEGGVDKMIVNSNVFRTDFEGIILSGDTSNVTLTSNAISGLDSDSIGIALKDAVDSIIIGHNNLLGISSSTNRIINTTSGTNIIESDNLG